jgi:hypothetical protein
MTGVGTLDPYAGSPDPFEAMYERLRIDSERVVLEETLRKKL